MKKNKDILIAICGMVVVVVVMIFLIELIENTSTQTAMLNAVSATDQIKGNPNAKITLVEYSDFQCPACSSYYPIVKKLVKEFGGEIKFVYRHFPLPQHSNADIAARAAEAAGRQGKFWEMHDMLFDNQRNWSESRNAKEQFMEYASLLQLRDNQFKADLSSKEIEKKVQDDYNSGIKSGINSTPSFFLNGKKLVNPQSYDEFKNIIIHARNEKV